METDTATPTKEKHMETNLQLVTLHDRATITNSKIVAEVFGKSHDDVLRAIRDLKNDVATGVAEEHLRNFAEMFPERLRNFEESFPQPEERRREFGEGAGKLISEPIQTQPPTEWDMLLAQAYDKAVERERNELDTDKCQFFKLTTYEATIGQGGTREFPMYEMNEDGFALLAMGFTGAKATMFKVRFIKEFHRLKNLVNEQLLLDSDKLHQIQDQSRWQEMEWRLQTLEGEKRGVENRLRLLETKGTVTQLQSEIRRGGFRDAANIFYPPVRIAIRRLDTAARQTNIETIRKALLYVKDLLHKSMDNTVNVTGTYDLDLEATYDEETIERLDGKCLSEFDANFQKHHF